MYNKTKPIDIKEFDLERKWWKKRVENEHAWKISAEEIKNRNYNLDIKNPTGAIEETKYSSKQIITMLGTSFEKSSDLLKQLKTELK
jgi:type I restriction enzyme M protein